MATIHYYVNHSKKQYFNVGLLGYGAGYKAAGFGISARALSLLISENGLWHCDSIALLEEGRMEEQKIYDNYTNISIEAEIMLLEEDSIEDFYEEHMFIILCDYALVLNCSDIKAFLDDRYGSRSQWMKKYEKYYSKNTKIHSQKIFEASQQKILLYQK